MADDPKKPSDDAAALPVEAAPPTSKLDEDEEVLPTFAETPEARAKLVQLQTEAKESDESARREAVARDEAGRIAASSTPAGAAVANAPLPKAWGTPIARFDALLTGVEERVLLFALLLEIGALVVWVVLRGFSLGGTDARNLILRIPIVAGALAGLGAPGTPAAVEWRRA